jgi:hypothetical protein
VTFEGITGTVLVSSGKGLLLDCVAAPGCDELDWAGFLLSPAGLLWPFGSPAAGACASSHGAAAIRQRDKNDPSHLKIHHIARCPLFSDLCYDSFYTAHKESIAHRMGLVIRSSAIHASGCFTTIAIRKGGRVAEYTGPRLTKAEADAAYENSSITYLFGLGDGSVVIDGQGTAKYINHSCDPNCESVEIGGRVWIKAIRNIAPGEEITYDYCLYDGSSGDGDALCNCGAAKCRGTMYSKKELRRRKAAEKKQDKR